MAGRKIRDEAEALAIVKTARERGEEPAALAVSLGIDGRSMNAWRMTLQRTGRLTAMVELVPVDLAPTEARYRVLAGGRVIEVGDDFRSDTLARLLEVVEAC